ncbi:tetratricopeptide repeat protein [Amaricoccus macauensis]|uniref:tetratricopeptide repeat protein n=1 Tax=Amaricoccus macauensis TaxID=57001 RepID=UPI003C7C4600
MLRKGLTLFWLLLPAPAPALADIGSTAECEAAIASDPQLAREEAGQWARSGGGVPAKICEAAALEALGATATAARLLSSVAENPSRAMPRDLRVVLFEDSAGLWLDAGQPGLALASLDRASQLSPTDPQRLRLKARVMAAAGDWAGATDALNQLIAERPRDAGAHALRAATLRHDEMHVEALWSAQAALRISPELPEGLFEAGAASVDLDDLSSARDYWLKLIKLYPDHALATPARRNLAALERGS